MNAANYTPLIEAALDQPRPTPALVVALNALLTLRRHPLRLTERDPLPDATGAPR